MDDPKKGVQEALNRSLSGLTENPFLAQRVIAEAKGESKMKKKITGALVLVIVLAIAMMGTGYALFSSQVAEFFGRMYGSDMADWLRKGKAAQVGQSVTVGDVSFTLNEVVYRNRALYGVGTAKGINANDVLVNDDLTYIPDFFAEMEAAQMLAEKAKQAGGRLLAVEVLPERIGVDGGEMLIPSVVGYFNEPNADGSLTFSFEVEDGFVLEDGESYQVQLDISVIEMSGQGDMLVDMAVQEAWTVEFVPEVMEPGAQPETIALEIPDSGSDSYELVVPEAYKQTGTLPVYQATAADLTQATNPEWFNESGIAEWQSDIDIIFNDRAVLGFSPESVWYAEYSDELYDANQAERERYTPDIAPDYQPMPAFSYAVLNIAADVHSGTKDFVKGVGLEHEKLALITLEEAKARAEMLLEKLGIKGFACAYALDMSVDRIKTLGEKYNEFWYESGQGYSNLPRRDYSAAALEDEGYYLYYSPLGVDHSSDPRHIASLYVNSRGVVFASIYNAFNRGEALYTPDALITPRQALEKLGEAITNARYAQKVDVVERIALSYGAVRAENKADGMVFVPIWQIQFKDGESKHYANINAVDGVLSEASFL